MPRKTHGMPFELHPRPTKGKDGKPLLYARPASFYKKTMADVKSSPAFRGLNSGLVDVVFETFIDVCSQWLADGYRVETPLGPFSPRIKLDGDYTDPSKVQGKNVKFAGIDITPSKRFVKEVCIHQKGFRRKANQAGNAQMYDGALWPRLYVVP